MTNTRPAGPSPTSRVWPLAVLGLLVVLGLAAGGVALWAESHWRAAQAAADRRDFAAARVHLRAVARVWGEGGELTLLDARCARRAREYADAERLLRKYAESGGVAEVARLERALMLAQRGDLASVEGYLRATSQADVPEASLVLEALAQGYLSSFRLAPAREVLDRLLEREPDHADALVWRGWVWQQLHRLDDAVADYRAAVAARPDHVEARLRLGEGLVLQGHLPEAVEELDRVRETRPDDPAALRALARAHRRAGERDRAAELLARLPADDAEALAERGRLALDAGDPGRAEPWLRQAVKGAPHLRDAGGWLAECLHRAGKAEEAAEWKARTARQDEDLAELDRLLGKLAREPGDLAARCRVGELALRNGRELEGRGWLLGVLQDDPKHPGARRALEGLRPGKR